MWSQIMKPVIIMSLPPLQMLWKSPSIPLLLRVCPQWRELMDPPDTNDDRWKVEPPIVPVMSADRYRLGTM
jgi:hypothetical protein